MSKSYIKFLVITLFITIILNYLYGQQKDNVLQKVYRYCYVTNSKEWYQNQQILWQKEVFTNPQNEDAWYNYYFASRYASMGMEEHRRKVLLDSIVDEIGKEIPDSYLYPYLKYYNGDRKVEYLEEAYRLKPDCSDLYWEFIQYYELNGMKQLKKKFCEELYLSKAIIPGLYDFNLNMLNSTEPNSILFTNGDNDNYPAWVLQEIKGIRQDVTILNVHTAYVLRDYLKRKLEERGIDIDVEILSKDDIAKFLKELINSIRDKYPKIPIHVASTVYGEYKKKLTINYIYRVLVSPTVRNKLIMLL